MADCMVFHTQIASIMEVLANAAVAEICKLVDDDYEVFRLDITQSQKENRALRRKLQLLELKLARERVLACRPSCDKIVDHHGGMSRGERHLTGGHRISVKPAGHNTWIDDQPITVDEGSGTSTQHVIVIESADAEAAGPGGTSLVKQERTEGEEDPQHSRDIQTGAASRAPPVATEDLAAQPRIRHSIAEVSGTQNAVLKSETDTKTLTVTQRLLHTASDPERLGCPPASGSEYLPVFHQSQETVNSLGDGDTLHTGGDLSCSYGTEMDPGNMPLGLETQTDLSKGDWNQYSSSVYSEGCLDNKGEGLVVDKVTVKVEGDVLPTWNADSHLGNRHLDYRESLETNPNVCTSDLHSPLFDQVLNSNDRARAQTQGGGATSGSNKEKRFLCMFCNKGFSCLQRVEIHQRFHTGEKPFSCTQCHMRFAQAGDLKRHQRVHTGEKPFGCHLCRASFSHSSNLKRHLKVHTGERLYTLRKEVLREELPQDTPAQKAFTR
ncbi:uncharacterized protein LOC129841263 [Salvelinus fontinalis]|uniref:uncharacterized protein LOC129841263 n=1 Tax=Salvelinus fontinalis TaxID=8038 RepID=UPI002485E0E8|nr:uncharacterized protein LOC129841263 [Salvelinus fontinalis]